ncbi:MAG: hypothetical protein ABIS68_09280, partial [Casimicrobiaceae bacterium]
MSATPTRLRRVRRYAAIGAIAIVAVVALTFLGLATSPGRNLLAGIIERVARVDGISITITNLSGWPPFRFGAEKIVIADVDGPFAQIDNLSGGLRAGLLLTGGIEIDSIAAERVSIARRPKPPPDQPASDPIALSIDKLSLPRVELGEQLVGRAVVLAVDGAYRSRTNGLISASIDAKRTDDKTGSARVRIERADRHAPLLLDAGVEEAADGILIGLLGRESGPAYRLTTKTEARGDALEGSVLLASSGTARFDGSFTLAPTATTKRLTAKGRGDVGELLPPDLTGLLSGPIDAAIDIEWGGATKSALPRIVVREGTITSTAVRAKASGTLDDTQSNLVLEVDVARADRKPIAIPGMTQPARFEHVTLTGHAAPANGVVRFELAGSVAGLALADTTIARTELSLTLSSSGRDPFAGGKITYALRISPDAIQMPAMRLASSPGAPLTLAADGTFDTSTSIVVTKVSVALGAARATFDGELSRSDVKGKAIAQVPELRVLAPLIGRTVSGALDVTADGTFFSAAGIRLKVDATGTGVDPGNPALARVFAGKSKIGTTLVRNAAGALSLSDLVVDAPGLKAKGSATIAAATIEAQLDGRLPDLSVFARDIEGGAQFALKASGARNAPTIDSTIKVERGKVYGKEVEAVAASLVGKPAANGWAGHLKLGGRYAGKRIEGDVDAAYEQASGVFNLSKIDVAAGDNRVRGALRRSPQGVLAGALDVTAPDLATLVALALIEASGSGNAKVTFAGAGAGQSLAIVFNGSKIKYQDIAVGTAEGTVDIDDVFGTPRVRGTVAATAVNAGALRLDTAKIGATVAGNATR